MSAGKRRSFFALLALPLLLAGCQSVGPRTVPQDRDLYSGALSQSQTEQLLLNIVRLHHGEAPTFVDVSQIVAGYELERDVTVSGNFFPNDRTDSVGAAAGGHFSDRPTITYQPLTGERYARSVVFPVPVHLILSLFESGWSADDTMRLFVRSLNGVRNRQPRSDTFIAADPGFEPLVDLVRGLQEAGAIEFRLKHLPAAASPAAASARDLTSDPAQEPQIVATFDDRDGRAAALVAQARAALGVAPNVVEIPVHTGVQRPAPGQIYIATYSMLQILTALGNGLPESSAAAGPGIGLLDVHVGAERPREAFTTIRYRNRWYWIDEHDHRSKQTLLVLVIVYRLLEWDGAGQQPLLTIPTG